jgi:hypothetical protein
MRAKQRGTSVRAHSQAPCGLIAFTRFIEVIYIEPLPAAGMAYDLLLRAGS